nr:Imm26 family immunity protein [Sutcliffiella horikoshii]
MIIVKKKKVKVNTGDVFTIKLDHNLYSYGQVVGEGTFCDCIVIYDLISREHPPVNTIISNSVILLIQTVNSRLENGLWKIIGNGEIPELNLPIYKVETEEGYMLANYKGEIIDDSPDQDQVKDFKELESWSPVSLENAVRAKFITGEWDDYYNDLIYIG